jgi:hypothetical protein
VRDGVIRRVVHKWLRAGVLEEGTLSYPEQGSPQGGVVSPLLSNIYLHEVLDVWFERMVKPVLAGDAHLVRFADDAVMVFATKRDALRVLAVLPRRFGRYGLTLHPEKTRLVRFRRPAGTATSRDRERSGSFDFLGFTHHWSLSRRGAWVVKRRTAKDRLRRALARIKEWCREHRHWPVRLQHAALVKKVRGHYAYYGLTCNGRALQKFRSGVYRWWRYWLNRRDQRQRMPWSRFYRLLKLYALPNPVVIHSMYKRVAICHAAKL